VQPVSRTGGCQAYQAPCPGMEHAGSNVAATDVKNQNLKLRSSTRSPTDSDISIRAALLLRKKMRTRPEVAPYPTQRSWRESRFGVNRDFPDGLAAAGTRMKVR